MNWRIIFSDIRFWICIGFALRLISIDAPIFDSHNWRQADGYAVARNFLEEDANILERRVDNRGGGTGITPSEFPLINYITYLFYLLTGVQWWPGRLINLAVTSLGIFSFHQIIKVRWNQQIALYSSVILLFSIWFSFGRKFMPDTFSASILLTGIWLQLSYLKEQKPLNLMLSTILISAGLLTKITSSPLLLFSSFFLLNNKEPFRLKKNTLIGLVISIIPVLLAKYKDIADCSPVLNALENINFQYAFQSFVTLVNFVFLSFISCSISFYKFCIRKLSYYAVWC